jgi:hypothetical protein
MKGRRTAAMLCVLLGHALLVLALMNLTSPTVRRSAAEEPFTTLLYFIEEDAQVETESDTPDPAPDTRPPSVPVTTPAATADAAPSGESAAITPPGFVDWPLEGKESAARVLAAEAEAERIAKMFAGPGGTWASLTKRQQSEISHFRWKPGIDGLERDENGNTIYRLSDRCVLVNFIFIGCSIGAKPPAYGDLFKDMRLHFDEQRRPQTNEGNGTEPESKRPPKWQKPLP